MNTLILNCSPKGNSEKSNSKIICEAFVRDMKKPCDIKCIAGSDPDALAQAMERYDTIIFVLPLYIHAMPGILMNLIEHMQPSAREGRRLGFIIQAGFIETAQERYVERYFASLAKQLNYQYLGTVSKGEAAGIYMFPKLFKKVLKRFSQLGRIYEDTHEFDPELAKVLGTPYELSRRKARFLQFLCDLGLNDIGWHSVQRKNHCFKQRLDRPYLQ